MTDERPTPWELNASLTIKAASEEEVEAILTKLEGYARRIGAGSVHTDYSGPQASGSGRSPADTSR